MSSFLNKMKVDPTTYLERDKAMRDDLIVAMLAMLQDLHDGFPWGELGIDMGKIHARVAELGIEEEVSMGANGQREVLATAPQPPAEAQDKWKALIGKWQQRAEAAGYDGIEGALEAAEAQAQGSAKLERVLREMADAAERSDDPHTALEGLIENLRTLQPAAVDEAMVERVAISIYAAARGFSAEVAREKWPSVEQKSRFTGPARAALGQETTND